MVVNTDEVHQTLWWEDCPRVFKLRHQSAGLFRHHSGWDSGMRKTSYVIALIAVVFTLMLNAISVRRTDWLVVRTHSDVLRTTVTTSYGLHQRCELSLTEIPGPDRGNGKITYRDYGCRAFPARVQDGCEKENQVFCAMWTSAGYVDYLGIGFAGITLFAILFGISTHSRRRRIWSALAGLTFLQTACQVIAFGMITDTYLRNRFPAFEYARPGAAYVLNIISWILSFFVMVGILITGVAANKGYRWAAGNRPYHAIGG